MNTVVAVVVCVLVLALFAGVYALVRGRSSNAVAVAIAAAAQYTGLALLVAFTFQCTGVSTGTSHWRVGKGMHAHSDARDKLQPGDRIVRVDGQPVYAMRDGRRSLPTLQQLIGKQVGRSVAVTVDRQGVESTHSIRLKQLPSRGSTYVGLGITLRVQREHEWVGGVTAVGLGLAYPYHHVRKLLSDIRRSVFAKDKGELTGPVGITSSIPEPDTFSWRRAMAKAIRASGYVWLGCLVLSLAMLGWFAWSSRRSGSAS